MKKVYGIMLSIILLFAFILSSLGLVSIPVKSIKLNTASFSIPAGKTFTLKASFVPENASNKKLIFSSGNKSIASVDKNGVVKGIKSGKTIITVTASNGVKAKCNVTIESLKEVVIEVGQWSFPYYIDNPKGVENDPILKYLSNKFKMKFKWTTFLPDNYNQVFSLMLATGNLPDIFEATASWPILQDNWTQWREVLLNSSKIVFENPGRYPIMNWVFRDKNYKFANTIANFSASDYSAILMASTFKPNVNGGVPVYNKQFLDNLKRSTPKTLDEFIDLLRAFVNDDPDKNGKKDTGGLVLPFYSGNNLPLELEPLFFRTNGSYMTDLHQDKNGDWYDAAIASVNKPIWKLLAQLFSEGIFDKEYITKIGVGTNKEDFFNNKFGAISERFPNGPTAVQWVNYLFDALKANPGKTWKDYVFQPTPLVGSKGDQVSKTYNAFSIGRKFMISKFTKVPDRVVDLVEYLFFSDEGQTLRNCGIKNVHYTIDIGGNIVMNKEKFRKEVAETYYPTEPTRYQWAPFFRGSNSGQEWIPYEKFKNDWLEANYNGVYYSGTIQAKSDEMEYYASINEAYKKTKYFKVNPVHIWAATGLIPKSIIAQYDAIRTKQKDIEMEYFNGFFSNKYDVDKRWDEFVSKYKAADPDNIVIPTWTNAVNEAYKKYENAAKVD